MELTPLPWQDEAFAALHALRGRRAHGVLLQGRPGIGKLHLALAFGAALLCEARHEPDTVACGRCTACALLRAGTHPDLVVITPAALSHLRPGPLADEEAGIDDASADAADEAVGAARGGQRASREIRIDQIHAVSAGTAVTSHRGGVRVVVIVPAETLNGPAANALLKTLEEPPGDTVFLLVSASPDELLPTIRSRCLSLAVRQPARDAALAWLHTRGVSPATAAMRLVEAGGAPLRVVDPPKEQLDEATAGQLLAILRRGGEGELGELVAAVGRQVPVAAAITLFQRWAVDLSTVRHAGRVLYHAGDEATLKALSLRLRDVALFNWLDALRDARASADHPLNGRLVVEQALIRYRRLLAEPASRP